MTAKDPQLNEYAAAFQANAKRVREIVDGFSGETFNWRANAGRWSVGECVEHLNATARAYMPEITKSITKARAQNKTGAGPFKYGWLSRWFEGQLTPPPKRNFKAAKKALPSASELDMTTVMQNFDSLQAEYLQKIVESDGLHLKKVKVKSPLAPLLRFELGAAFQILAVHDSRHLWQMEQVIKNPGFPKP